MNPKEMKKRYETQYPDLRFKAVGDKYLEISYPWPFRADGGKIYERVSTYRITARQKKDSSYIHYELRNGESSNNYLLKSVDSNAKSGGVESLIDSVMSHRQWSIDRLAEQVKLYGSEMVSPE